VSDLPTLLRAGDRLVVNDTRGVPARLFGEKARRGDGSGGGRVEFMLERFLPDGMALARLRSSKSPKSGARLVFHAQHDEQARIEVIVERRESELFVLRSDHAEAKLIMEQVPAAAEVLIPEWVCDCGETVDAGFSVCWSCGNPHPDESE